MAMLSPAEAVRRAKLVLGFEMPNSEMTDSEIRAVIRYIGCQSREVKYINHVPQFSPSCLGVMLLITAVEFPEFYSKYELSQEN